MQPIKAVNGTQLKGMLIAGSHWLAIHVAYVNSLNVFPVPDGDTGTNMMLTMQAALSEALPESAILDQMATFAQLDHETHAGRFMVRISQGALSEARGNSGTILSQILVGFAQVVRNESIISIPTLADAFSQGADCAYAAVLNPVEGTILTVIKAVAQLSQQLARSVIEIDQFFIRLLDEAKQTLLTTPDHLPVLKAAEVVDSGGQGLVFLLEGMVRFIQGLSLDKPELISQNIPLNFTRPAYALQKTDYCYDVQYTIQGTGLNISAIRSQINTMGLSPLVVGDEHMVKVHIYAADPEILIRYGESLGKLSNIVIENMAEQFLAFWRAAARKDFAQTGVICLSNGLGFGEIFSSLGAGVVVQTHTEIKLTLESLLKLINQMVEDQCLILPNGKLDSAMANQAADLAAKETQVIPTATLPEGVNAMVAFDPHSDLTANQTRMIEALNQVSTIEIVEVSQFAQNNGHPQKLEGFLAHLNGQVITSARNLSEVSLAALTCLDVTQFELVTLYYNHRVTHDQAQLLAQSIHHYHTHLEVEVLNGGQHHCTYIISLE